MASRRMADRMIQTGRVTVNGITVSEPGSRVILATDVIAVDGVTLSFAGTDKYSVLMLNKPVHVVSTTRDPQGRKTVLDLLPKSFSQKRIYPVGRLDYFSEGLLLLTNDGDLTLRLTHPRYHLPKVYAVRLREHPTPTMLDTMRSGMTLAEGERLAPVQARLAEGPNPVLLLTLNQGVNRQIRRMCRDLGLTILRLVRTGMGPLSLGELASGTVRELTPSEIAALKKAVCLEG